MVQVVSESFECKVPAKRMWHGLFKDAHNCLPKAMPSKVLGVEYPLGQHGFDFPGAERIIKFRKGVSKEEHKTDEFLHKEEGLAKGEAEKVGEEVHKEAEKVGKEVHKEELLEKEKAEELRKEELLAKEKVEKETDELKKKAEKEGLLAKEKAEKEADEVKEKVEEVGGSAKKEGQQIKEGLGGVVQKGVKFIKETVGGAAHQAASRTEKVVEKEKEEEHKAIEIGEKLVHKEEEEVEGALHKVGEYFKKEELWVKEKVEEVEYEACKITIHVVAGGLIGIFFKHYKHTFELKEHEGVHGSILHWTTEFETLSSNIHLHLSYDKLKEHVLNQFHSVEAYLLKHGDYA